MISAFVITLGNQYGRHPGWGRQWERDRPGSCTALLSAASYMIYSTLVKKAPEAVSIEELAASIKKNAKTPSRNTVVCLISRIRTALRTAGSDTYDIIKSDNGYRLIKRTAI